MTDSIANQPSLLALRGTLMMKRRKVESQITGLEVAMRELKVHIAQLETRLLRAPRPAWQRK